MAGVSTLKTVNTRKHMSTLNWKNAHKAIELYDAPDFVKQATENAILPTSEQQPTVYADSVNKQYPIHTAAATWLSASAFLDKCANNREQPAPYDEFIAEAAWKNIIKAANYFDILPKISELANNIKKANSNDINNLDDTSFALIKQSNGEKQRFYPLRNAMETQQAASYLLNHRDEFSFEERHTFATKVLTKAAAFGANVTNCTTELEQMAGAGLCTAEEAVSLIKNRLYMVDTEQRKDELCQEMYKLAELIEQNKQASAHWSLLHGLANVVDSFDRLHKLNLQYTQGLPRPEEVLFNITKTAASVTMNTIIENGPTGTFYKAADLQTMKISHLTEALGNDVTEALSSDGIFVDPIKAAEILPTLPRPDAKLFDAIAAEAGISPTATKQASDAISFDIKGYAKKYKNKSMWSVMNKQQSMLI